MLAKYLILALAGAFMTAVIVWIGRQMILFFSEILDGDEPEEPDEMVSVIDGTHPMYTEEGCKKILKELTAAEKKEA